MKLLGVRPLSITVNYWYNQVHQLLPWFIKDIRMVDYGLMHICNQTEPPCDPLIVLFANCHAENLSLLILVRSLKAQQLKDQRQAFATL